MTDNENNSMEIFSPEAQTQVAQIIKTVMSPIIEAMAHMMKNNTDALDRLAVSQQMTNDRMEALEKQIRLNTLVTTQQVRYFNDAIRKRARDILAKHDAADDAKAIKALGTMIRKAILSRYGVGALHDIPKHEYNVVLSQVATWNDLLCIRDVMKGVRERTTDSESK